jgi:hypothetical protein
VQASTLPLKSVSTHKPAARSEESQKAMNPSHLIFNLYPSPLPRLDPLLKVMHLLVLTQRRNQTTRKRFSRVISATDHSVTNTCCRITNERIQVRNHSNVWSVENGSHGTTIWKRTCDYIQERNHTTAHTVIDTLYRLPTWGDTLESIPERNHTIVNYAPPSSRTLTSWKRIC